MMTLEEVMRLWTSNSDELLDRYKSVIEEFGRNPDILQMVMVLRDSKQPCQGILLAFQLGVIFATEMEKGTR